MMRRPYRLVGSIVVVALVGLIGCGSGSPAGVRTTVIDSAHGVKISTQPALLVGGYGESNGRVRRIGAVAVDSLGTMFIADNALHRVTEYKPDGSVQAIRSYSTSGADPLVASDSLRYVQAMACSDSNLYLLSGTTLWIVGGAPAKCIDLSGFSGYVRDMAVGRNGLIYLLNDAYYAVYDSEGTRVDSVALVNENGKPAGARAFAVSREGTVVIAARAWGNVVEYGHDGKQTREIAAKGLKPSELSGRPTAVGIDSYGNVYVYDAGNDMVKVYRRDGQYVADIGGTGSKAGETLGSDHMLVDRWNHRLIVADPTNYRLQIYDLTGRDTRARNLVVNVLENPLTRRPSQIVLSLGSNTATDRGVAWKTDAETTESRVEYIQTGDDPATINWVTARVHAVKGASTVFYANLGPYCAHQVDMTGLIPGKRYVYRVGDGMSEGWSDPAVFSLASQPDTSITVAIMGDSRNHMDVWHDIITGAANHDPDFIVHGGDFVGNGDDFAEWTAWFAQARTVFDRIPFVPCMGNHERQSSNYFLSFDLPRKPVGVLQGNCYSFDYGPSHWVVLNTEIDMNKEAAWLKQDLARNTKAWVFACFHRPAYAGNLTRGSGNQDVRDAWEKLFDEYGVDAVWQGHDHYYYRSKPVRMGNVVAPGQGPIYVTTAGAGAPLYPVQDNQYTAFARSVHNYCIMHLTEDKCSVNVYEQDGSLLDSFMVAQCKPESVLESKSGQ